jgi:hypothetical protein
MKRKMGQRSRVIYVHVNILVILCCVSYGDSISIILVSS